MSTAGKVGALVRSWKKTVPQFGTVTDKEVENVLAVYRSKIPPKWNHKPYTSGTDNRKIVGAVIWGIGRKQDAVQFQRVGAILAALQQLAQSGKIPIADWNPAIGAAVEKQKYDDSPVGKIAAAVTGAGKNAAAALTTAATGGESPLKNIENVSRNVAIIVAVGAAVYLYANLKPYMRRK